MHQCISAYAGGTLGTSSKKEWVGAGGGEGCGGGGGEGWKL